MKKWSNNGEEFHENKKYIFVCAGIILAVFCYLTIMSHAKKLDTWLGKYDYLEPYEHISGEINYWIDYEIIIFEVNDNYYAEITGDGWFTETRTLGYIKGDENTIDILFKDTLPWDSLYVNGFDRYEEDELLITLSYTGTELYTSWHALRDAYPTLGDIEGEIEGIYFEKDMQY